MLALMNQINIWYTLLIIWNFKKVRLAENQEFLYIMTSNNFFFNIAISSMFQTQVLPKKVWIPFSIIQLFIHVFGWVHSISVNMNTDFSE